MVVDYFGIRVQVHTKQPLAYTRGNPGIGRSGVFPSDGGIPRRDCRGFPFFIVQRDRVVALAAVR